VSPWISEFPDSRRPDYPKYQGDRTAGVVVVGGGLTGCLTAHACAAAGLDTLLLERNRIGHGSAGRSGGLILPDPGPDFRDIARAHGLRAARHAFELWRRAALDGAALLRRLHIRCDLQPATVVTVSGRGEDRTLRREFDARRAAGLDVSWLTQRQAEGAAGTDAAAAVRVRDGFALDPYRACVGVAAAAKARRAVICERSHVKKVTFTRKYADVIADGGVIRTTAVVIATGTATPEFKPLMRHFKQREMYLARTERIPAAVRRQVAPPGAVVRDSRTPPHCVRWAGEQVLVAGADQERVPPAKKSAVLLQRTGQLMYELSTMYPAISGLQPDYGWDVLYGQTADGLMYIGAHRNYPFHHFAIGGSRDSVTGSFLASRMLLRAIQERPEKGDEVFGWNR
jgi:glycine/D-amino acid oxidase-like deaminating enzyme